MKNRYLGITFTKHIINRLYNRGISQSDAWQTFQHPDGSVPGKTPGSRKFYKNFSGKKIEIVAKKNEKGEWVILTGWVRHLGQRQPSANSNEPFLQKLIGKLIGKSLNKAGKIIWKRKK